LPGASAIANRLDPEIQHNVGCQRRQKGRAKYLQRLFTGVLHDLSLNPKARERLSNNSGGA
jgi:hypothetical protein